MYKDIISYELADGISEEQLLKVAGQIVTDWMAKLPGFISWEITKEATGHYSDIVSWDSKSAASNAEKEMGKIPNAADWFACYREGSISSKNVTQLIKYRYA